MSNTASEAQQLTRHLQGRILSLKTLLEKKDGGDLNELSSHIADFEQLFSEKSSFLPSYDVKKLQASILSIKEEYQARYQRSIPKKRFAFKSRSSHKTREEIQAQRRDKTSLAAKEIIQAKATLEGREGETIRLETADMDPLIRGLKRCEVILNGSVPSTVHLTDLVDCSVLLGPVRTSVFIERCRGCTFHVFCQQLRMHESRDCSVYLHVTSKGIIEGCSNVGFAPYSASFEGLEEGITSSGLDKALNHWDEIQDFNWLTPDQPSPNWFPIPEKDRLLAVPPPL